MINRLFFAAILMLTAVSGTAGTLTNGVWTPSSCGSEPAVPVIEQGSVDEWKKAFNICH